MIVVVSTIIVIKIMNITNLIIIMWTISGSHLEDCLPLKTVLPELLLTAPVPFSNFLGALHIMWIDYM